MDPSYLTAQPVEVWGRPSPGLLLKSVYSIYGSEFRRWFGITAPTSVLAAFVLLMADQRIRGIYGSIPRGQILHHLSEVTETFVLRFGSFFITWFLGCFALAAIATAVNGLDGDDAPGVWRSDGYQRAREHFSALLQVAFLTFCAFLAGAAVIGFVELALFRAVGWSHFPRFNLVAVLTGYVLIASIVSWFGIAIPLILSDDIGAWTALKRSVRRSNGYEGFLFLLVVESLVGSYVAWYATHFGLTFLFPSHLRSATWYGWIVYLVSVLASAAVQPPMFIGFSLLASNEHSTSEFLPSSRQTM